jgi:drug/metabolite transporter superfamily protein YnfA
MRQEQSAGGHAADAAGAIRRVRLPSPAAGVMLAALALVLILYGAYLVLTFLARDFRGLAENAADIPALVFAALGAVVARHQPRNPIGWLLAACGGLYLLTSVTALYAVLDFRVHHGTLPMGRAAVLIGASVFLIGVIIGLVIVLFPDGALPSRRWRPVLWAYAAACAMYVVHLFVGQSTVLAVSHVQVGYSGYPLNLPAPSGAAARVAAIGGDFFLVILACWVCFVGRQVLGYRRAAGERREQLKWLMSGAAICIVAGVAIIFSGGADSPGAQAAQVAGSLGIAALPVGISIGILKYRLYDIDRIISRTLAYAIVTGLLVGLYAGLVLLATEGFRFHGTVAVAASTLAVAALFNPLRRRVQRMVDRRFNRARYDADQTVMAFAARLKDAVDLDSVRDDLAQVVSRALEPAHLSVWVSHRD